MKAEYMPDEHADRDVSNAGKQWSEDTRELTGSLENFLGAAQTSLTPPNEAHFNCSPSTATVAFQLGTTNCYLTMPRKHKESMVAALALLLGPETDYTTRARAVRRLAGQGPALLPLLLKTLNNHPEITSPPWPWWPPQYEHVTRLLIYLCQSMQLPVQVLLEHPALTDDTRAMATKASIRGPVLWISVIEVGSVLPYPGYESFLCEGLQTPWKTVRYAAAMALAKLAEKVSLHEATLEVLRAHQSQEEDLPVRLAASCALLRNGETSGLETLMSLLLADVPEEARKGAIFILATESSALISSSQRERLTQLLLLALQDSNAEIAMHAVRALRDLASPSALPALCSLLASPRASVQIAALATLEEVASRKAMRRAIQHYKLPAQVIVLLRTKTTEVRRQACFTLAAFGGAYAAAALGTILIEHGHPAYMEAIEALRLLPGVLKDPTRTNVVRWFLSALHQSKEEVQITALESLIYLLWQAKRHGRKKALYEISKEIVREGTVVQLLEGPNAWVRQRVIELVSMLDSQPELLRLHLTSRLHFDPESEVRACIAYTLGQMAARWAIPALIQALLDPDEQVTEVALHSLVSVASLNDPIVVYVVKELGWHSQGVENKRCCIEQRAQALLKKWRKTTGERQEGCRAGFDTL